MPTRISLLIALVALCGCKSAENTRMKAVIGAVLLDGSGGPPLTNSVVVTSGDRLRAAGATSTVPIPMEADKIDGSGKFLVPGIVDVYDGTTKNVPGVVHLFKRDDSEIEKAREAKAAIIGHIGTLGDVEWMVKNGVTGCVGMIGDIETLDPDFLAKLRDLKITFAPALVQAGKGLDVAKRNTFRLFSAGVPIALATGGGDPLREAELLGEAGIPPQDVIVAITRHGALALHRQDVGLIAPGSRADLLLLSANPGEDIRNLRKVTLRMTAGEVAQ